MDKRMNKRAGIFAVGMVIAMVVFMSLAWMAFSKTNVNINAGITKTEQLDLKNSNQIFRFYTQEAAKLSASQALHNIAKNSGIAEGQPGCTLHQDTIVWSDECGPKREFLEEDFLEKYTANFNRLMIRYPDKEIEADSLGFVHKFDENNKDIVISKATKKITNEASTKATFATYNISVEFDPSTTFNLGTHNLLLDDFEKLYLNTLIARDKCKGKESNDASTCFWNNLPNLEKWVLTIQTSGNSIFLEFKTIDSFFFEENGEEKFEKLSMNVIIEL